VFACTLLAFVGCEVAQHICKVQVIFKVFTDFRVTLRPDV
jgi:hypothetical protein